MLSRFKVQNFRCFADLSMSELGSVNLITGANSVGKTTLLEALFLLGGATNITLLPTITAHRGITQFKADIDSIQDLLIKPLFFRFLDDEPIVICGEEENVGTHSLRIRASYHRGTHRYEDLVLPPDSELDTSEATGRTLETEYRSPSGEHRVVRLLRTEEGLQPDYTPPKSIIRAIFLFARGAAGYQADVERFGHLEVHKRPYDLVASLRTIEPRLTRITTALRGSVPMLHGDVGLDRLLPLPLMGDGTARLASLLLAIGSAERGMVLIDEIENGLHHSAVDKVWRLIDDATRRFNVQVFATTHSLECVKSAYRAFSETMDRPFRLHRLERSEESIRVITYDWESFEGAMAGELEVR